MKIHRPVKPVFYQAPVQPERPKAGMAEPTVEVPAILSSLARFDDASLAGADLAEQSIVHTGHTRWMIPYADLLTLLLGLFMLLYAMAGMERQQLQTKVEHLQAQLVQAQAKITSRSRVEGLPEHQTAQIGSEQLTKDSLIRHIKDQVGLSDHQFSVSQQPEGLVLSLQEKILFDPGSADLNAHAQTQLNKIADILKDIHQPIRVEGHTDNTPIATGQYPSNWELSTARATHILKYLINGHRFSPQQLSAAGYGEFHPVAENSSIEGKQKNRRVDIVIVNKRMQNPGVSSSGTHTGESRQTRN